MRIAFVTAEYPPDVLGGAGIYAQQITEHLASKGTEVVVFTLKGNDRTIDPHLKVVAVPSGERRTTFKFWTGLRQAIKEQEKDGPFDLVHVNGLSFWFFQDLSDHPVVTTIHHSVKDAIIASGEGLLSRARKPSSEEGLIVPRIERRAVRRSDGIIAVSQYTKGRIVAHYSIDPSKVAVIPNGIDNQISNGGSDVMDRVGKKGPLVLFIGRLDDPRKGFDVLLSAFPAVTKETGAVLIAAGRGDKVAMAQKIADLGLADKAVLLGFVSREDLDALYSNVDLCVVPSRMEGFGFTVADAMRAGRAVVASEVGAIPEVIVNKKGLVGPGDPKALADLIVKVLKDRSLRSSMEEENKRVGSAMLTWDQVADETVKYYSKLINKNV